MSDATIQPSLTEALNRLWERFLPEFRERLNLLEPAAVELTENRLPPEVRNAAHSAAHKLAGVLGTFNLNEGTELARALEQIYAVDGDLEPTPRADVVEITAKLRGLIEGRK